MYTLAVNIAKKAKSKFKTSRAHNGEVELLCV